MSSLKVHDSASNCILSVSTAVDGSSAEEAFKQIDVSGDGLIQVRFAQILTPGTPDQWGPVTGVFKR